MAEIQEDQLRIMAERYPDEVAYRHLDAGTALTFGEWNLRSDRLARSLYASGITKGDRVAIDLPNEDFLDWLTSYCAIHKAGAVAVPFNSRLTARELVTIANHAEISAVITARDQGRRLVEARAEIPSLGMIVSADRDETGVPTAPEGTVPFDQLLDGDEGDFQVEVETGDLADIMYTSGTTGTPKGVAVRHRNVSLLPNNKVRYSGRAWMHSSPPFTFAGISFVFNPMKMGMLGLYQARFDAGRWFAYIAEHRPIAVFIVPAMAQLLINHEQWATADLDSLEMVAVGSAPLPPETLVQLCERLPRAVVTNSYGMTEAGPAYCGMPEGEVLKRIGSVGKPMPPMEVRIVDPDGVDLPAEAEGEVLVRLQGRQREYYRDPEATARTWSGEGWLRTGDIGKLDEDGFLYIVGRSKDVIIRGGNNVHAADVESVLIEHPGVLDAAVVGVPHDVLGEDIAAFVVPAPGTALDVDEVQAFCAERLADYKCPRQVHVVDELPRNPTGKVVKRELVEQLIEH